MLTTVNPYDEIISGDYNVLTKVVIDGHTYDESTILSVRTANGIFQDDTPTIGNAISSEIEIEMIRPNEIFSRMAEIVLWNAVTNGKKTSSWIKRGVFYIDTRRIEYNYVGQDTLKIIGYDALMKSEQYYDISDISYPIRDVELLKRICNTIGISIENSVYSHITGTYNIYDPHDYKYREILKYIAAGYAGNFIITAEGNLRFIPLNNIDKVTASFNLGTDAAEIVSNDAFDPYYCVYIENGYNDDGTPKRYYKYDTSKYSSFDQAKKSSGVIKIENDIITDKNNTNVDPQVLVDNVYSKIHGWTYIPYTATDSILPIHLEIGDKIVINKKPTSTLTSGIYYMSCEYGPLTVTELKAPFDEDMDHEFSYDKKSTQQRRTESSVAMNASDISTLNDFTGITEDEYGGTETLYSRIIKGNAKISQMIEATTESLDFTIEKTTGKTLFGIFGNQKTLYSMIEQNAESISAKVGQYGGNSSEFGWTLTADGFYLYSTYSNVMSVNSSGSYINGYLMQKSGNKLTCKTLSLSAKSGSIANMSCPNGRVKILGRSVVWKQGYLAYMQLTKSLTLNRSSDTIGYQSVSDGSFITRPTDFYVRSISAIDGTYGMGVSAFLGEV